MEIGPYRGDVAPDFRDAKLLSQLAELRAHLEFRPTIGKRSDVVPITLEHNGAPLEVAVKSFRAQGWIRSRLAGLFGSKAHSSWTVARAFSRHGLETTPAPIAYLERWESGRLRESYYLSVFEESSSLHDELIRLYHHEPELKKFVSLLTVTVRAVRQMHRAGIRHGDMGNQNILLRRHGPTRWGDVRFIDLNRGRVKRLTWRERGAELSRLTLPAKLRRVFRDKYLSPKRQPKSLRRWESFYVFRLALQNATRSIRRPIRSWRTRRRKRGEPTYPGPGDIWIWDTRGGQAFGALSKTERILRRNPLMGLYEGLIMAVAIVPTLVGYLRLRRRCYEESVALKDRVGMTIEPSPETAERELELLRELGKIPVLVRFYRHQAPEQWDFLIAHVKRLHAEGFPMSIAMVQDRRAITKPELWRVFVEHVLAGVGDVVEWVEIGHAVNRIKWGIWNAHQYRRLARPFRDLQKRYPNLKLMGTAVNDFEFHYVASTLGHLPRRLRLNALSLHLYVDRRGAPENKQYVFSSVDKFVMARAIARLAPRCEDRLIVSEVNWFLQTGWFDDFVTEDQYADYMIRYYLHALCSGMVERVYWWRLVARDFGLVDDRYADRWRIRPAHKMLAAFVALFGESTYLRLEEPRPGLFVFRFRQPDGGESAIAYSAEQPVRTSLPFAYERAVDAFGEAHEEDGPELALTGRPLYLFGIHPAGVTPTPNGSVEPASG